MSGEDSVGVTLAHVDPSLVSCWNKMVKQGEECSLLLKLSKGKVVATLQCSTPVKTSSSSSPRPSSRSGGTYCRYSVARGTPGTSRQPSAGVID